jgi:hypothetical protein
MPEHEYDVGDIVRLRAAFTIDAAPVDPTSVTFKVRSPDGDIIEYATVDLDHTALTGVYERDVVVDAEGRWFYRAESTGAQAAGEASFYVKETVFS